MKHMKRLEKPKWQAKKERSTKLLYSFFGLAVVIPFVAVFVYFGLSWLPSFTQVNREGSTITVGKGDDLQAALDNAKSGDTIVLQAGAAFRGSFRLPKKPGNEWVTITTSAHSRLPKEDERISPKKHGHLLPRIGSDSKAPALITLSGAHHFRFVGVLFEGNPEGFANIVQIGTGEETNIEELPDYIEFDRVIVRAVSDKGQRRGIAANGRNVTIKNSHISGIRRLGEESQAIAAWATNGPIKIINNYLEAAGENILFGGASSELELTPSNVEVVGNTLHKPTKWRKEKWVVKNLFEIKNGKDFVVRDNLMTNNWAGGQDGTAILFTVRKDSGETATIENVVFENNIIRGSGGALNIYGSEGNGGKNLTIRNNLFEDIDSAKWGGDGQFLKVSDWEGLRIENNTGIFDGNITTAYGKPVKGLVMANNVLFHNEFGLSGDETSPGVETLSRYFPGNLFAGNVIVGGSSGIYGTANSYPTSRKEVGFNEDYEIGRASRFLNKGNKGQRVGFFKNAPN